MMKNNPLLQVKRIIKKWPAYRKFVESMGILPLKIESIDELPVIDKQFVTHAIHMVPLFKVRSIIPSSGSTGVDFSFGLFGDAELKKASYAIDSFLEKRFNARNKKTLVLNLLPGAVSLQSSAVSVVSIGVRVDTAISAIKSFGSSFEQLILVGEPLFIKKLIESGGEEGVQWRYLPLFIIIGGEWVSENYRSYIEGIVGFQRVLSSMGMAELGLNYFYETEETIALRRILLKDRKLLKVLAGNIDFCPALFSYNEDEVYVETTPENNNPLESILLTTTDIDRVLPLIRYRNGDKGKVLQRSEIQNALKISGYPDILEPEGSPILAHLGRGKCISGIYPEKVKDIIYLSGEIASTTTGNFQLCKFNNEPELMIQLKEDVVLTPYLENMYNSLFSIIPVNVRLCRYEDFPNSLNFEFKARYVNEDNSCDGRKAKKNELPTEI